MPLKDSSAGAFIKGVDASTGLVTQPRGSVPRGLNMILTKRGALQTCDGTAITSQYNGAVTPNFGKALCLQLFSPIGVTPYPVLLASPSGAYGLHIDPPQNLAASVLGAGGLLPAGTYYYVVTAFDGQGETTPSNEVSVTIAAGQQINLTWHVVPNIIGYHVYRGSSSRAEQALQIVVNQPALGGSTTISFSEGGIPATGAPVPTANTTGQTALFALSPTFGGAYNDSNILGLFPAVNGSLSGPNGTPSGGIAGSVSNLPQMLQFVNQMVIALGNGLPPQLLSDPNTSDNAAPLLAIASGSIDAFGVVTITTTGPHGLSAGANVRISGAGAYNDIYVVIAVLSATQFQVRNVAAIGAGPAPPGTVLVLTQPIQSTFQAQFDPWAANTAYPLGKVVVPTNANGYYYKVVSPASGGTSGATAPTWPTTIGATVQDNNITWQCAGITATAAPPPPGAAHIEIYANALWVWNTYPTNTANGLDGPSCLRMSDVGEPNSWNPVNQAFLDKDDGSEGMGLAVFTITAQGIPPQGAMIACKNYATYQISSVFGDLANFRIQRATTDLGCISPRTLQFIPGYGIARITHLGVSVFDGVNDRLISPQVEPYLFYSNDPELHDIGPADSWWLPYAWAAQTSFPPMYCLFIPIGNPSISQGRLTRALCFDLVLRAWGIVSFPFDISCAAQYYSTATRTLNTFLGSFSDGTVQRWQAQDTQWATSVSGSSIPAPVIGEVRSASVASKDPDQRIYARRVVLTGQVGYGPVAFLVAQPRAMGVILRTQKVALPTPGSEFSVEAAIGVTSSRFDVILTFSGDITLNDIGIQVDAKPIGVLTSSFG